MFAGARLLFILFTAPVAFNVPVVVAVVVTVVAVAVVVIIVVVEEAERLLII